MKQKYFDRQKRNFSFLKIVIMVCWHLFQQSDNAGKRIQSIKLSVTFNPFCGAVCQIFEEKNVIPSNLIQIKTFRKKLENVQTLLLACFQYLKKKTNQTKKKNTPFHVAEIAF